MSVPVGSAPNGHKHSDGEALGSFSIVKTIYEKPSNGDQVIWVDEYPKETIEVIEGDKISQAAIVQRMKLSELPLRGFETDSIVIQSPDLRDSLKEYVFKDFPGLLWDVDKVAFTAPFKPFVLCWEKFKRLKIRRSLAEKTREQISLLYNLLDSELQDIIETHKGYKADAVVPWRDLWMIFKPGDITINTACGTYVASEILQTGYEKDKDGEYFSISHFSIDWKGDFFGYYQQDSHIREYNDSRGINTLPIYPLIFHENKNLPNFLTLRGKKFEELARGRYKSYDGAAITWNEFGENEKKLHVSGRIILDSEAFAHYSPFSFRKVRRRLSPTKDNLPETLTPHHHMLCLDRLYGYSPQLHTWMDFFVDNIKEIQWRNNTLDGLVIPQGEKDLLVSIVRTQGPDKHEFSDFIAGKGEGITILLSGPPGTGKTLTAEAIAEDMRLPLNTVTFANLGENVYAIERQLSKIFALAAHWNCILLLDECDVFLGVRSPERLEQNNMVSIFLRALEYYKGVLFMTTNHSTNIDPAFSSRIHLSLEYKQLNRDSRLQVWNNVLTTLIKSHDISQIDMQELAKLEVNGRQIKNIARMAQLLALSKKQSLKLEFIRSILAIESRPILQEEPQQCHKAPLLSAPESPINSTDKETTIQHSESTKSRKKRRRTGGDNQGRLKQRPKGS